MKCQIEAVIVEEIQYSTDQCPAGIPQGATVTLEIEELIKDPRELMALDAEVVGVRSVVLNAILSGHRLRVWRSWR